MADNHFSETVEALFRGMDTFVTSKTVVGNAVRVDHDTVIIPLIDVSCGMAAGAFNKEKKNDGAGGLSAKMSPSARALLKYPLLKCLYLTSSRLSTLFFKGWLVGYLAASSFSEAISSSIYASSFPLTSPPPKER